MKLSLTILAFVFIGNLTLVFALDSVEREVIKIKKASPSQRVDLMNKFKEKMALMSQQEREYAITTLKKYINRAENSSGISEKKMIVVRRDEDAQAMQKQTMQQVIQYQTAQQKTVPSKSVNPFPFLNILGQ